MEAVNPNFEGVKPFFDVVSINIVKVTAQFKSREVSQISSTIDEKLSIREIVFLGEFMQKRSSRISASPFKQCYIEDEFSVKIYCSIHPRSIAVSPDSGFINRDPPTAALSTVWNAVSQPMYPVSDRLIRAFNAE